MGEPVTQDLPPPPAPPVDLVWLVEPRRPGRVRRSPHGPWLVVATVCIGAFMGQLDASIVTLALPPIQRHFHATLGGVEWVSLAYLVALVVLVVPVGRLADMLGRKLLYVYGFAVFTLGSVACGVAPTLGALVALRAVQALGAALLQANSVALIATAVPRERLGRAIGLQGVAQAVGLAAGPAVGGALVAVAGWRSVFLVNAPIGVIGIVSGLLLLPRTRTFSPLVRFDWAGLALFAAAVGSLLFVLSYLPEPGRRMGVVGSLATTAVAAAAVFAWRERRAAHPLLGPALFRQARLRLALVAGLLSYLVMFGVLFSTPFLLAGRHVSATTAGLVVTALPVGLAVAAPLGGRLADRYDPRLPTAGGMALCVVALLLMAVLGPGEAGLAVLLAVVGAGLGAFTPANNAEVMASAPPEAAAVAGGVINMTRGVGTSLGVALTGLVLAPRAGATAAGSYRLALWLLCGCAAGSVGFALARWTGTTVGRSVRPTHRA